MRGDAFIHFVSGSRRVNTRLGVLLLIPKSPQTFGCCLCVYIALAAATPLVEGSISVHSKFPY